MSASPSAAAGSPPTSAAQLVEVASAAQVAARSMAVLPSEVRNSMLEAVAEALKASTAEILAANAEDLKAASAGATKTKESQALLKRLEFTTAKLQDACDGIDCVKSLPDPLGRETLHRQVASDGKLTLRRITCPIGVLCIIYEARPEAGIQIASLAIKSGNALILKGGKEAVNSNRVIYDAIRKGLQKAHSLHPQVPVDAIQLVEGRAEIDALLKLDRYIDLVIPRGSNALVRHIKDNTKIPVLGHADGICHTYVDAAVADLDRAVSILTDAKCNYPAGCNATETILLHENIAAKLMPKLLEATKAWPVHFVPDAAAESLVPADRRGGDVISDPMSERWRYEYLDYVAAVKVVKDVDEAIAHINHFSSHHTDAIITDDSERATHFQLAVDSASVYVNCSTRFADGFRYGFGAEVGISTSKIHSRGPVGVDGLVIYKYLMTGAGHCVGEMGKTVMYEHKDLAPTTPRAATKSAAPATATTAQSVHLVS